MKIEKSWTNLTNLFATKPRTMGVLLSLILSIAVILISILNNKILKDEEQHEMESVLTAIHQNIDQSIRNCYATTVSLALTLNNEGVPQNFDTISKRLLHSNPIVSAVQLVPNGVIKYIYPMDGNEAAMDLNILTSEKYREEAEKSIETQKIYFAGPLTLKQGGVGIVGRLPLYNNNSFWGFSAVVIKLETLLNVSGINAIDHSKYYFQFSKKDTINSKEEFFLPIKKELVDGCYLSQSIADSNWVIYLINKKDFPIYPSVLLMAFVGIIIAILFGLLSTQLFKKSEKLKVLLEKQETKLLKNEFRFKTIFERATVGFAIIDIHTGELVEANKKYYDIFGYNHEEIQSLGLFNITHPDDLAISLFNKEQLKKGEIREYRLDKRCITKLGKTIWINLTVSPLWEAKEKPTNYIAFVNDITPKKESEELIKKSEEQYRSLIDNIDGIVWEFNLETMTATFISKKIEVILGYKPEDYITNPRFWEDHIHPDDLERALETSSIVKRKNTNYDHEYRMINKKGDIIWIRDIVNFVFEDEKPVISRGIMIDITKMKESEKDLNNSLQLVTEQNKRLLNFSYIVSHNLRSHTSNIESIIALMELATSEEERNEMMGMLKTVSISLDETMKHLNEVVNINTNMSLIIQPLNLNMYIEKAKEVLKEQIILSQTTFITHVPFDATIHYNSAYLESILYNLISNAIRYKHEERKPIITIKFYKEKNKDVLEISDNGIGIDLVKNGDKVFGMYKTFSTNSDARGIGLFITKNQVDAMGGALTLDSIPNVGSTFKIYT